MATENQLTRHSGASPRGGGRGAGSSAPLPRVSATADNEDTEDEKIYYGFGVFMGLPLADLKAMKEDYVEQQARNGGPSRRALPSSAVVDGHAHRVEDEEVAYERQNERQNGRQNERQNERQSERMGAPQSRQPPNGYPREGQRQYSQEAPRYASAQGEAAEDDGEDTHSDVGSDGSYSAQKSHSLNFILH